MKPALTTLVLADLADGPTTSLQMSRRIAKVLPDCSPSWITSAIATRLSMLVKAGRVKRRAHAPQPTVFELVKPMPKHKNTYSEGASDERTACIAHLRRELRDYQKPAFGPAYNGARLAYKAMLEWVQARKKRFDAKPGGLGKTKKAK